MIRRVVQDRTLTGRARVGLVPRQVLYRDSRVFTVLLSGRRARHLTGRSFLRRQRVGERAGRDSSGATDAGAA